jgi:hypothetical protein
VETRDKGGAAWRPSAAIPAWNVLAPTGAHLRRLAGVAAAAIGLAAAVQAQAATGPTPPDDVQLTSGLDLGNTSFFAGFGKSDQGFEIINYSRYEPLNEFTTSSGRSSPSFVNPNLDVAVDVVQGVWALIPTNQGAFGFTVLQPIINFDSSFGPSGTVLHDNGLGFGDTVFGPLFQSKPIKRHGRTVFAYRLEFDVNAPTGGFDPKKDINQGAGYWSITPYAVATWLPTPKWEVSGSLHYLYNFSTTMAADPAQVPGFIFRDGQSGQAAWVNFDASYKVADKLSLGVAGYYLKQYTDDQVNGVSVPDSKKEELYLGPGAHIPLDPGNIINVNAYLPVETKGLATGPQFNVEYIHPF